MLYFPAIIKAPAINTRFLMIYCPTKVGQKGKPSKQTVFKIKTGKTYTNFLHEIRIKHACKLLTESNMSISQISNECGFVNFANFFRIIGK